MLLNFVLQTIFSSLKLFFSFFKTHKVTKLLLNRSLDGSHWQSIILKFFPRKILMLTFWSHRLNKFQRLWNISTWGFFFILSWYQYSWSSYKHASSDTLFSFFGWDKFALVLSEMKIHLIHLNSFGVFCCVVQDYYFETLFFCLFVLKLIFVPLFFLF